MFLKTLLFLRTVDLTSLGTNGAKRPSCGHGVLRPHSTDTESFRESEMEEEEDSFPATILGEVGTGSEAKESFSKRWASSLSLELLPLSPSKPTAAVWAR